MITLDDAIKTCADRDLTATEIKALCRQFCDATGEALDGLAYDLARRYLDGQVTFTAADGFMNSLFAFALRGEHGPPTFMRSIYDAFDAGEYLHRGDPPGTDSEAKYTRPAVGQIVAGRNAV
jgi:hypothetical protein